jgi:hypothetical protein
MGIEKEISEILNESEAQNLAAVSSSMSGN